MRQVDDKMPIPYLTIDKNYQILEYTKEATELMELHPSFLDLIDEGSHSKVKKWLHPETPKIKLEVNLNKEDNSTLVNLYVNWINDLQAEVMIVPTQEGNQHVSSMLERLQARLNDTNFELLEEKDKLTDALNEINQLSAPYIELTHQTALIPLFGFIDKDKLEAIKEKVLVAAHNQDHECLLFDFTAVADLNKEGVQLLKDTFNSLIIMGKEIVVVGMKPNQAKRLHELRVQLDIKTMHSLQLALDKYCT